MKFAFGNEQWCRRKDKRFVRFDDVVAHMRLTASLTHDGGAQCAKTGKGGLFLFGRQLRCL